MKKKILFINPWQFGYMAGYFYYAKYLCDEYDVEFICRDEGFAKLDIPGVKVTYITTKGNKLQRLTQWLYAVSKKIQSSDNDTINYMVWHRLSWILRLLFLNRPFVLDIRTGKISENKVITNLENVNYGLNTCLYKNVTVLSEGLIDLLHIRRSKAHVIPLGADTIEFKDKNFDSIRLFYIGTFNRRRIEDTILGLKQFLNKRQIRSVSYDIVGFGYNNEDEVLKNCIKKCGLEAVVKLHGRLNHEEALPLFEKCNIGISYVPIIPAFEFQPPTKIYEYAMAGLVTIATNTFESRKYITPLNGILIKDTADAFCEALNQYWNNRDKYNSAAISKSLIDYSWENIVNKNIKQYLLLVK